MRAFVLSSTLGWPMGKGTSPGVTLQISLAPTDLPHARHILLHQLRQWGGQVDEVLLTVDMHRSGGRFGERWRERLPGLVQLVADCQRRDRRIRAEVVDYRERTASALSSAYFGGAPLPAKNYRGAPFYSYFFALDRSATRYVLHMDSDMLYGGGSQSWVAEGIALLRSRSDVLCCAPLPGPPTPDGSLHSQSLQREPLDSLAYRANHLSTRHFLMDLDRLRDRLGSLTVSRPSLRYRVEAVLEGNPAVERVERLFSAAMHQRGLIRVEFLGRDPGMWSVHPQYRSGSFYQQLPSLIEQIESGDIPEGQRGYHDLNASMVDWGAAPGPRPVRLARRAQHVLRDLPQRWLPANAEPRESMPIVGDGNDANAPAERQTVFALETAAEAAAER